MAEELSTLKELRTGLDDIAGSEKVFTDDDFLEKYSIDTSFGTPRKPDAVVKVLNTEEIQKIVKFANRFRIPVTPKSSSTGFYGAAIAEQGGIVLDMSDMKRVLRIDKRNKWAMVEPGVTLNDLQAELAKQGMSAFNSLLPHKEKSFMTGLLEREPRLTPKHHLDETIQTMEIILPTGEIMHTGSMAVAPGKPENAHKDARTDLCNAMGPGLDWYRLIPGSLGTYGIVTAMNVKAGFIPVKQKLVFICFDSLEEAVEPFYKILRKLIGDECFLVNSRYLASIISPDAGSIKEIQKSLPPFVLILNIKAGEWMPDEKMEYQEEALHDISKTFYLKPLDHLPNIKGLESALSENLYKSWDNGDYWKCREKGASKDIFFLTQLQRAPEFLNIIKQCLSANNYPLSDMGIYIQPKQNGRAFHMEAGFAFNPDDLEEKLKAETIFSSASRALHNKGAFFYRIYGQWADMVYSSTGELHQTLKRIKKNLDPENILNPGKLGF